jgi:phosphonopyruvate decarboxylase
VALVVRPTPRVRPVAADHRRSDGLLREDVLCAVLARDSKSTFYVTTTGYTSREWHRLVRHRGVGPGARTFFNVGAMGYAFSIAMGFAIARGPSFRTVCLDGDGAALMHLGQMAMAHARPAPDLLHVLVQNGVHESVGGSPTAHPWVDFATLGGALGYVAAESVDTLPALEAALRKACADDGPRLLVARCVAGTAGALPRPDTTPAQNVAEIRQAMARHALTEA